MRFEVKKTWGTYLGFSCAFRQWSARGSHCRFLHGYALGVTVVFETDQLDDRNWVYDFGSMKWIKNVLEDWFDHKTVVALDDPKLDFFKAMDRAGMIELKMLPAVGCEKFAEFILTTISNGVSLETNGRVKVKSVEVFEHGANSAKVNA